MTCQSMVALKRMPAATAGSVVAHRVSVRTRSAGWHKELLQGTPCLTAVSSGKLLTWPAASCTTCNQLQAVC